MKIGVIGGTALDSIPLDDPKKVAVNLDGFDLITLRGTLGANEIVFLHRHSGSTPPHAINHARNVTALKHAGVDAIVGFTACGSYYPSIPADRVVIPEDFIDATGYTGHVQPDNTLKHPPSNPAYDPKLRDSLIAAAHEAGLKPYTQATLVSIRGPRFGTYAEGQMWKKLGADIVNMTTAPEAAMALEAEVPYATLGFVTDIDSAGGGEPATLQEITERFATFVPSATQVLSNLQ